MLGAVVDRNSILFRLKEDLREMIDPDFLLPAELMNQQVLKDAERQNVKARNSLQERNDILLNFVLQKNDALLRFVDCLHKTDQQHVCNFISCGGGKQLYVCNIFALL